LAWPTESGWLDTIQETPKPKRKTGKKAIKRLSGISHAPYRDVILTFEEIGETLLAVADSIFAHPYYHWYQNGSFIRTTRENSCGFRLDYGEQAIIACIDTAYENFDPIANAPEGYPAVYTLYFIRSLSTDVKEYVVQYREEGGSWADLGKVVHDEAIWEHTFESPKLNDKTTYEFQAVPYDVLDNEGTPITITDIYIRRVPDAPDFSASYSQVTNKITWSLG